MNNSVFRKLHNAIDQWHEGQQQISLDALKTMNLSFADDLAYGLEHQQSQDKEQVRTELVRRAMNFLRDYRQGMRPLELIYYLAPVLGLLGTVLGMIDAFRGIAENANAGNEGATLAGGIWEALLTTAVGLTVAIFFTVLHSLLASKLEKITLEISDLVERVQQ
jgi:biopolymer transport protein ExbB